ncbi:MAG: 50S ribosomal protein L21 [Bdellovibrionota bacterium]
MYAIIKTGGKQYTVRPGDVIHVEKLDQELGSEFNFPEILFVGGDATFVGSPLVADAVVTAVVTKQAKSRKVIVFKKKRRHSYRKFATHRQTFTEIFIKAISAPNGKSLKSDETPRVQDMAQVRQDRIASKMETRKARVSARGPEAEAAAKKPAKKAAAPKKTAGAGKSAPKKAGAKKKTATKTKKAAK